MSRWYARAAAATLLISTLAGATGCTPGSDGSPETDATSSPEGDGGSPDNTTQRSLDSCHYGSFEFQQTDTSNIDEIFSGLDNRVSFATMRTLNRGGEEIQLVNLSLGASRSERVGTFRDHTWMYIGTTFRVDGPSGSIDQDGPFAKRAGFANRLDGDYYGNGKDYWHAPADNITGTYNLERFEAGEHVTGELTIQLPSTCATSLSSFEYTISFDVPLVDDTTTPSPGRCGDTGAITAPVIGGGETSATIDGEPWTDFERESAEYGTEDGSLYIHKRTPDRHLYLKVDNTGFGQNSVSEGFYKTGDCTYEPTSSQRQDAITVEDNDSGQLTVGPTRGEFDLSMSSTGSNCPNDSVQIRGEFGVAVCRQAD